jgi:hypothetical protein
MSVEIWSLNGVVFVEFSTNVLTCADLAVFTDHLIRMGYVPFHSCDCFENSYLVGGVWRSVFHSDMLDHDFIDGWVFPRGFIIHEIVFEDDAEGLIV